MMRLKKYTRAMLPSVLLGIAAANLYAAAAETPADPNNPRLQKVDPEIARKVNENERKANLLTITNLLELDKKPAPASENASLADLIDQLDALDMPGAAGRVADKSQQQPGDENSSRANPAPEPKAAQAVPTPEEKANLIDPLLENPDNVPEPLYVAEALYKKNYTAEAGVFYEVALRKIGDDKENPDRPWILFQTANCVRFQDPAAAIDFYRKLIEDYPDSEWTEISRARIGVLEWFRQKENLVLLEKYAYDSRR